MKHCIALGSALVLCFAASASAATEDGGLACRLVDKPLIEHLSGEVVRDLEPDARFVCAGMCPSLNASLCKVSFLRDTPGNNAWTVWVYQPPFEPGDWISNGWDDKAQRQKVDWRDARAVWEYRADQQRGFLTVWANDHRVLVIVTQEHDARNGEQSLSAARVIAARALTIFGKLK